MSIEKRIEHLERLAGVKQDRINVFITSYANTIYPRKLNCKECSKPKEAYPYTAYAIFPNKDCDCEDMKNSERRKKI